MHHPSGEHAGSDHDAPAVRAGSPARDAGDERSTRARSPLRTVARFAAALRHDMAADDLFDLAIDAAREATGASRAALLLRDAEGAMRCRVARALTHAQRVTVEALTPNAIHDEPGAVAIPQSLHEQGVGALASHALIAEGRSFGRLDLFFDAPRDNSEESAQAAEAIAGLTGLAIARAREAVGRRLLVEVQDTLGTSSDVEATLASVARLVVERIADSCAIHLLRDEQTLERAIMDDRDPAKVELMRRIEARYPVRLEQGSGPARAIRTGTPQLVSRVDEALLRSVAADAEHLDLLRHLDARSLVSVPLIARGRVVGALTAVNRSAGHTLDELDLEILNELSRCAALAVDAARLHRAEREARQLAERATERTERLRTLAGALADARTTGRVAEIVLQHAMSALGAAAGAIGRHEKDGGTDVIAAVGHSADDVEQARQAGVDAPLPFARVVSTGEPLFGMLRAGETGEPEGSWVAIPLAMDGVVIGALGLSFHGQRRLDGEEWLFLQLLARQSAQALERARLLDAERRARADAADAQRRLLFLAEANALFASSLDFETRLQQFARLAVGSIADYCLLFLDDASGALHHASAHADPAREPLVRRVEAAFRPDARERGSVLAHVARTGKARLVRELRPEFAERATRDPEVRTALLELGARSAMVVPLHARGRVIGSAIFISTRPDRVYDRADLAFAEELVRRAAVAVDNARLYREALDANQSKANFLAVMSHELRTPLTAILGYAELLADEIAGPVNDSQREQLLRIRASGVHLLSLIEEILSYARLEAAQEIVKPEAIDLRALVDGTRILIEPLVLRKRLRYSVELPPTPVEITTDIGKVRQILLNLLANAVKFTNEGEIALSVEVGEGDATFHVRDTGIGIPSTHLEHIFEPFWQVQQTMTRQASGTGLGLSVARRLAQMLGGELTVKSMVAAGSTFTLRVPVRAASAC